MQIFKSRLLQILKACERVVAESPVDSDMRMASFRLKQGVLTVSCSNPGGVHLQCETEAKGPDLELATDPKRLSEVVSRIDCVEVAIDRVDGAVNVIGPRARVSLPASNAVPSVQPMDSTKYELAFSVQSQSLADCIKRVLPATARFAMRYAPDAVQLELRGGRLVAVATDEGRLHSASCPVCDNWIAEDKPVGLLGQKAIQVLLASHSEPFVSTVLINGKAMMFQSGVEDQPIRWSLVLQQSSAKFPDWRRAVHREPVVTFAVNRDEMLIALRGALLADDEDYGSGASFVPGEKVMEIKSESSRKGAASFSVHEMGGGVESKSRPLVRINPKKLIDAIECCPSLKQINIDVDENASAVSVYGDDADHYLGFVTTQQVAE